MGQARRVHCSPGPGRPSDARGLRLQDRKSTRLNSSHLGISYAVFCLKKKEHTSELQSLRHIVCRLLIAKKTDRLGSSGACTLSVPTRIESATIRTVVNERV